MSVLIYLESSEGVLKKSSFEAAYYGSQLAQKLAVSAVGLHIGKSSELDKVGSCGLEKVINLSQDNLSVFSAQAYAVAVHAIALKISAKVVVMAKSSNVDSFSSRLGIKLGAAIATNVTSLANTSDGFVVRRSIFTGKAFTDVNLTSSVKVVVLKKNAIDVVESGGKATVEEQQLQIPDTEFGVRQKEVHKASGDVLLPEAEIVVSGGRGLKGPENWGILTDLANALGAATACSKPVSDMDWRPHHEHVGQTGIKVSPNLYIAIGISGAIQHLAGVNSSKCIVVINKDPEAPFFKSADYGIVGDAFEIVPRLTAAVKKLL